MFAGTGIEAIKTPATTTIVKQTNTHLCDNLNSYVICDRGICDMQHLHNCWQHQHHQKFQRVQNFMNNCIIGCWHQHQEKHFMLQILKRKNILLLKKFKKSSKKIFKGTTILQRRTSSMCCSNMMRGNMIHV